MTAIWGNSYVYTANSTSQLSTVIKTDKIRIAAPTSILVNVGNASITANISSGTGILIPGGTEERSFYVGQGNYIAYTNASNLTPVSFTITELGAPYT